MYEASVREAAIAAAAEANAAAKKAASTTSKNGPTTVKGAEAIITGAKSPTAPPVTVHNPLVIAMTKVKTKAQENQAAAQKNTDAAQKKLDTAKATHQATQNLTTSLLNYMASHGVRPSMLTYTESLESQAKQQQKQVTVAQSNLTAAQDNLKIVKANTAATVAGANIVIYGQQSQSDEQTANAATQKANTSYATLVKTLPKGVSLKQGGILTQQQFDSLNNGQRTAYFDYLKTNGEANSAWAKVSADNAVVNKSSAQLQLYASTTPKNTKGLNQKLGTTGQDGVVVADSTSAATGIGAVNKALAPFNLELKSPTALDPSKAAHNLDAATTAQHNADTYWHYTTDALSALPAQNDLTVAQANVDALQNEIKAAGKQGPLPGNSPLMKQWTAAQETLTRARTAAQLAAFKPDVDLSNLGDTQAQQAVLQTMLQTIQNDPQGLTPTEAQVAKSDPLTLAFLKADGLTLNKPLSAPMLALAKQDPASFALMTVNGVNIATSATTTTPYKLGSGESLVITVNGKPFSLPSNSNYSPADVAAGYASGGPSSVANMLLPYLPVNITTLAHPGNAQLQGLQSLMWSADTLRTQIAGTKLTNLMAHAPSATGPAAPGYIGNKVNPYLTKQLNSFFFLREPFWTGTAQKLLQPYLQAGFKSQLQPGSLQNAGKYMLPALSSASPEEATMLVNLAETQVTKFYGDDPSNRGPQGTSIEDPAFLVALSEGAQVADGIPSGAVGAQPGPEATQVAQWLVQSQQHGVQLLGDNYTSGEQTASSFYLSSTQYGSPELSLALHNQLSGSNGLPKQVSGLPGAAVGQIVTQINRALQDSNAALQKRMTAQNYAVFEQNKTGILTTYFGQFTNNPDINRPIPVSDTAAVKKAIISAYGYTPAQLAPPKKGQPPSQQTDVVNMDLSWIQGQSGPGATVTVLPFMYAAPTVGTQTGVFFDISNPQNEGNAQNNDSQTHGGVVSRYDYQLGVTDNPAQQPQYPAQVLIDGSAALAALQADPNAYQHPDSVDVTWHYQNYRDFQLSNDLYPGGTIYTLPNNPLGIDSNGAASSATDLHKQIDTYAEDGLIGGSILAMPFSAGVSGIIGLGALTLGSYDAIDQYSEAESHGEDFGWSNPNVRPDIVGDAMLATGWATLGVGGAAEALDAADNVGRTATVLNGVKTGLTAAGDGLAVVQTASQINSLSEDWSNMSGWQQVQGIGNVAQGVLPFLMEPIIENTGTVADRITRSQDQPDAENLPPAALDPRNWGGKPVYIAHADTGEVWFRSAGEPATYTPVDPNDLEAPFGGTPPSEVRVLQISGSPDAPKVDSTHLLTPNSIRSWDFATGRETSYNFYRAGSGASDNSARTEDAQGSQQPQQAARSLPPAPDALPPEAAQAATNADGAGLQTTSTLQQPQEPPRATEGQSGQTLAPDGNSRPTKDVHSASRAGDSELPPAGAVVRAAPRVNHPQVEAWLGLTDPSVGWNSQPQQQHQQGPSEAPGGQTPAPEDGRTAGLPGAEGRQGAPAPEATTAAGAGTPPVPPQGPPAPPTGPDGQPDPGDADSLAAKAAAAGLPASAVEAIRADPSLARDAHLTNLGYLWPNMSFGDIIALRDYSYQSNGKTPPSRSRESLSDHLSRTFEQWETGGGAVETNGDGEQKPLLIDPSTGITSQGRGSYGLYLTPQQSHPLTDVRAGDLFASAADIRTQRQPGRQQFTIQGGPRDGQTVDEHGRIEDKDGQIVKESFDPSSDLQGAGFLWYHRLDDEGNTGDAGAVTKRIYVNASRESGPEVMGDLVSQVVDNEKDYGGVYGAKIANPVNEHLDSIVIYANNDAAASRVVNWLKDYQSRDGNSAAFHWEVPPMTQQVAPGISLGDEPTVEQAGGPGKEISFGQLRSNIIDDVLMGLPTDGSADLRSFTSQVLDALSDGKINTVRPHLNATPTGRSRTRQGVALGTVGAIALGQTAAEFAAVHSGFAIPGLGDAWYFVRGLMQIATLTKLGNRLPPKVKAALPYLTPMTFLSNADANAWVAFHDPLNAQASLLQDISTSATIFFGAGQLTNGTRGMIVWTKGKPFPATTYRIGPTDTLNSVGAAKDMSPALIRKASGITDTDINMFDTYPADGNATLTDIAKQVSRDLQTEITPEQLLRFSWDQVQNVQIPAQKVRNNAGTASPPAYDDRAPEPYELQDGDRQDMGEALNSIAKQKDTSAKAIIKSTSEQTISDIFGSTGQPPGTFDLRVPRTFETIENRGENKGNKTWREIATDEDYQSLEDFWNKIKPSLNVPVLGGIGRPELNVPMKPDETVEQFAQRKNTTVEELEAMNENDVPATYRRPVNGKHVGQALTLPAEFPNPNSKMTYRQVSKATDRPVESLAGLNDGIQLSAAQKTELIAKGKQPKKQGDKWIIPAGVNVRKFAGRRLGRQIINDNANRPAPETVYLPPGDWQQTLPGQLSQITGSGFVAAASTQLAISDIFSGPVAARPILVLMDLGILGGAGGTGVRTAMTALGKGEKPTKPFQIASGGSLGVKGAVHWIVEVIQWLSAKHGGQ